MRIYCSDGQYMLFESTSRIPGELPLALFKEQVCLLKELGAELIDANSHRTPTDAELLQYRISQNTEYSNFLAEKQAYDSLQKENHIARLGLTIPKPKCPNFQVELEMPWFDPKPFSFNWPTTSQDIARYQCYRQLYHNGYWITQGLKFGGDYLLYSGLLL
jgi:tRNA splicing endonuclease